MVSIVLRSALASKSSEISAKYKDELLLSIHGCSHFVKYVAGNLRPPLQECEWNNAGPHRSRGSVSSAEIGSSTFQ